MRPEPRVVTVHGSFLCPSTTRRSPGTFAPVADNATRRNGLVNLALLLAYFGVIVLGVLGLISVNAFMAAMVVGAVVGGAWLWWTRR